MEKTTVYLTAELKAALARSAQARRVSEASIIRTAVQHELAADEVRPRFGIFSGGETIADRVDELLADGFGE